MNCSRTLARLILRTTANV
uniref:Uncharacterized protein n=1 Tax=Arundo donax TaxID=35708 RepID=A0A0A9GKG8_ARUDO